MGTVNTYVKMATAKLEVRGVAGVRWVLRRRDNNFG
jgi:hypothetical protein